MEEDLYVINGKAAILSSLLNGNIPSAKECHLTPEDFEQICVELYQEGYLMRTNLGNVLNAEVSDKGMTYLHTVNEKLS
ncbi:MAG TPA: hypothetical protein VEY70_02730 [Metabacillus sp.]|nr:hypothetical protein [Metabacillus sp.]